MTTGYACPVCGDPQADAGHLANHLAFTAMLRDDGHATWLDEHVPDWVDRGEADLAAALRERDDLEPREFPQVFEDTTGEDAPGRDAPGARSGELFDDTGDHGHDHGHGHDHQHAHDDRAGGPAGIPEGVDVAGLDDDRSEAEHEAILEEARELTRRMHENAAAADEGGDEEPADATDDAGTGETDDEA
jgi:hypothetical protein